MGARILTAAAHNPRIFIAYAPRAGLRCAIAYLASPHDVYGWYMGPDSSGELQGRYFVLEDYYRKGATRYVVIGDEELHSSWTSDEARCHELAELQDAFAHEWLFFRGDAQSAEQVARYAQAELALGDANVKYERLARFAKEQPTWIYASHGFEGGVLEYLARRWPLDYATGTRERARSGSPQ